MNELYTKSARVHVATLLAMAAWFGIITGLVEGLLLLLFQRLNWRSWGPMMHVGKEIIWISPVVDVAFFAFVVLIVAAAAAIFRPIPAIRTAITVLTAAAVYDWLTATARLTHRSSLLLAVGIAVALGRWVAKRETVVARSLTRTLPYLAAVAVIAFAGIQIGPRWQEHRELSALPVGPPNAPNVLVIVVDTLRADRLSSYGYARATSPNIDRIAREGVLFENAIAPCSWSYPSHISLLTGEYEYEHGIGNVPPMPVFGPAPKFGPTLGEVLEAQGYRTAAFSANRTFFSRDLGFTRGFTHFEDYFHSPADMFVRTVYGKEFARIYLVRSDKSKPKRLLRWLHFDSLLDPDEEGSAVHGGAMGVRKRASVVNQELLRWIDSGSQHPFFAFINYFDVHSPYGGPYGFKQAGWAKGPASEQYDKSVEYVDDMFGQLMNELSRRGLTRNTILVLTSDHGESLGQHGLSTHGAALYRELIRVPLIFRYPGHVPEGIRVAASVSNAAIAATIMQELGFDTQQFPTSSVAPLWSLQPPRSWPDPISELAQNDFTRERAWENAVPTANSGPMKSLVSGQFHVIVHQIAGNQLYDWTHDPNESNNLVNTPEGQEIAHKLVSSLEAQVSGGKSATTSAKSATDLH